MNRVQDEMEIRGLLSWSAHALDHGDLSDYLEAYADEAVWTIHGTDISHVGADRIMASSVDLRANGKFGPGSGKQHHVDTVAVAFESDQEATATSHYALLGLQGGTASVLTLGVYRDTLRRTGDGWRILRREVRRLESS